MDFCAKRKYRQITVAGDLSQRLHADGVSTITDLFPYISQPVRQISLDRNFRQSKSLAALSACFRSVTEGGELPKQEPCRAPVYIYDDRAKFAELAAAKIGMLPDATSIVVISPNF